MKKAQMKKHIMAGNVQAKKKHMMMKDNLIKHMMMMNVPKSMGGGLNKNPAKYNRSLGHNVVTSLVGQTTTSLTVTTGAHGAESSDFLPVVSIMYFGASGTVTCADSLGNAYEQAAVIVFNTSYTVALFYVSGVHSITRNAIITVTHPASTRRIIMGDEFKNITKTDAADQVAAAHNTVASTFATSGMTAVLAQDKELLYGVIGVNGPSIDTFKGPSNWNLLHDRGTNASDGNDIRLITQFRTTGSTGPFEVSGTLGTARLWGGITQSFLSEGGSSDVSRD